MSLIWVAVSALSRGGRPSVGPRQRLRPVAADAHASGRADARGRRDQLPPGRPRPVGTTRRCLRRRLQRVDAALPERPAPAAGDRASRAPPGRLIGAHRRTPHLHRTHHDIYTAPTTIDFQDVDGRRIWPLDRYGEEGARRRDWLAPGVRKQHRTLGTWINCLVDTGFTVQRVIDWRPSPEQIAAQPRLAEEVERPMFLIIAAGRRPGHPNAAGKSRGSP